MRKFARYGDFCPNPACPDYGKPQREYPLKDSVQSRQHRTLAVAAELTEHTWTVEELLTTLPLPRFNNNKREDYLK